MAVETCEIKKEKSAESFCRLCFTERDNYRFIFGDKYSSLHEWIENLTTLKIIQIPTAPASLCLECENTLQNFASFREMCFTNDRVIKEMFTQDDSRNSNAAVLEGMPVVYETKTDQCKDQKNDILVSTIDLQADNTDIKIDPDQCKDQQRHILDFTIGSQQNSTDLTIEYQYIKFEVDSSVCSEDENDKTEDAEDVLEAKKNEFSVGTITKEKRRHICNLCNKEFMNSNRLKIHIRSHTQERPHKCKQCGKSFITPSNLKRHMQAHTGIKPYSCDLCPSKYTQSSHLKRHKRVHLRTDLMSTTNSAEGNESSRETDDFLCLTGSLVETTDANGSSKHKEVRPYQCKYCHKGYNQMYKLRIHTRTHTNEKPFACSHCNKAFTNSGDLKIHVRSHTQERPFNCKEC